MAENFLALSSFALSRVIDVIYKDEEELSDVLYFVISLASELTGAKGGTIRVLEKGNFKLKVVSSYGLSKKYLNSGAIDYGKSVTEIMDGDIIIINDFETDPRIQNLDAAKKEGLNSVIGIPFTVNDTTYSILRTYFALKKVPSHDEMQFLDSLGKLVCLAIERAALGAMRGLQPV